MINLSYLHVIDTCFLIIILKNHLNSSYHQNFKNGSFPGGSVIEKKNLPASAGDMGLIPDLAISHMPETEQLTPGAATTEPTSYNC